MSKTSKTVECKIRMKPSLKRELRSMCKEMNTSMTKFIVGSITDRLVSIKEAVDWHKKKRISKER